MELTASPDPLAPGRYTRTGFLPRVTFEVDGPWHAVQLFTGFFDIQQDVDTPDVIAVQFATPDALYGEGGSAVALADLSTVAEILTRNPGLEVIESSDSRMSGLEGFQVTVENAGTGPAQVMRVPPGPLMILPDRRLWMAFFDTPDGVLAVMVGGSVAKWSEALVAAEPVLESVTIGG
jgi:hypothetical protein